jgi:hypothetical protein
MGPEIEKMAARAVAKLKAIDLDMKIASEASSRPVQGKQKNRIAALMRITRAQKWPRKDTPGFLNLCGPARADTAKSDPSAPPQGYGAIVNGTAGPVTGYGRCVTAKPDTVA